MEVATTSETVHIKFSHTETWDYPASWGLVRACGLFSAQQIDQKRRDQNRNERPGAVEAKENGEH